MEQYFSEDPLIEARTVFQKKTLMMFSHLLILALSYLFAYHKQEAFRIVVMSILVKFQTTVSLGYTNLRQQSDIN